MAENQDGQEKTEQPTAKRLQDARRKGQVPRSRELNAMTVTLLGVVSLVAMSQSLGDSLLEMMSGRFVLTREEIFNPNSMLTHLGQGVGEIFFSLAPFFLVVVIAAIFSSIALGGIAFSSEALTPKLEKLSPIRGMKRVFSARGLVELLKAMAKFLLIGGITMLLLYMTLGNYLAMHQMELGQAIDKLNDLIGWSVGILASSMILIAAIDVPFQLWDHRRQLKMTRQELRDEMKDTEGKPEVKGRIRQLQKRWAGAA